MNMIIVRFGELFIKSKPVKERFLNQLTDNIEEGLRRNGIKAKVINKRLRLFVTPEEDEEEALKVITRVFGVVSASKARVTRPELDEVTQAALEMTQNWEKGTYAVRAQRITKNYPFTSTEAEREVGGAIQDEKGLKVDLDNPNKTLFLEFYGEKAHLFKEKQEGPGGLPLGVAGTLKANIETEKDLAACWMMMKRGCLIQPTQTNPELKKHHEKWSITNKKPSEIEGEVKGTFELKELGEIKKKKETPTYTPLIGLTEKELNELTTKIKED